MKVPCGGFKIDNDTLKLKSDGTLYAVGGGGSIPKPLGYDYMPDGYPKKIEFTGVLMEEQSVPNNGDVAPVTIELIEGKTYTVTFDGTNYECVCHKHEMIEEGETEPNTIIFYIGNPSAFDLPETSEPFLYAYLITPSEDVAYGTWIFYDEQESHTISVQGTGIKTKTISTDFLPTGELSPYEPRVADTKKVYVVEYHDMNTTAENLYNEVKTAYDNGYYVLLYYYAYNAGNNPRIYTLSRYFEGTFWFVHFDEDNGAFNVIKLYSPSSGEFKLETDDYTPYYLNDTTKAPDHLYLKAYGTNKLFEIKVDGSGTISATEVTS